ncbi:MAG: hypothetical protein L3J96_08055 [Thermoplasmata archaeon]|nr:hypothetical protein [Thermoplasmata archaeon]
MEAPSAQAAAQDPVRATLIEILKQLNSADAKHEGARIEQALELAEIKDRLDDFWGVTKGQVKIQLAVGLLLRNGLVTVQSPGDYSWQRQRTSGHRYAITAEGKKFLVGAIQTSERIP